MQLHKSISSIFVHRSKISEHHRVYPNPHAVSYSYVYKRVRVSPIDFAGGRLPRRVYANTSPQKRTESHMQFHNYVYMSTVTVCILVQSYVGFIFHIDFSGEREKKSR